MKSISIVIPNYNGHQLLAENLPFVYSALVTSGIREFEIIIADDYSSDGSCEFIKKKYPDVLLVEGDRNLGFSGNMNRGIFKASKDLVFLLNSDVSLNEGYFSPCMTYFEDPNTFGVMGSIVSPDGTTQDGAKYPEIVRLKIKGTINYRLKNRSDKWLPTFFLSGANALVDRQKLIEIGGFDELYNPYYAEDVDLSIRAWRYGYNCFFEERASCIHPISGTISRERKSKVDIIRRRNRFFIHFIQLGSIDLIFWFVANFFKLLSKLLLFDSNYLKSFREFLLNLKLAKQSRSSLKSHASLSLREVVKKINDMIKDQEITKFRV